MCGRESQDATCAAPREQGEAGEALILGRASGLTLSAQKPIAASACLGHRQATLGSTSAEKDWAHFAAATLGA